MRGIAYTKRFLACLESSVVGMLAKSLFLMLFKSSVSVHFQILHSVHLRLPCNLQCVRASLCVAILLLPFMNLISSNAGCSCGSSSPAKIIKPNRWAWQENSHQQAMSQLWACCSITGEDMNHLSTRETAPRTCSLWRTEMNNRNKTRKNLRKIGL